MKKQIATLSAVVFCAIGLWAQKGSWGELPMIPNKSFSARSSAAGKIKGTPPYEKALQVYERLREARGDFRYPVPTFYMTQRPIVAEIAYDDNSIYLSEKAFEVCESFGAQSQAAIAFLLGHELTHYYEKHAWRGNFAWANSQLSISRQLDSLFLEIKNQATPTDLRSKILRHDTLSRKLQDIAMEAQSDYLGGFLAYSAGYGIFDQGDELIRRLYKAFDLPEVMDGYVTRRERENMSRSSSEKMKDLVEVFEMANLLTAIGEYGQAYRFYRKVLVEYQSREVYNNVGVTALLQVKTDASSFRYPIQLDLEMASSRGPEEDAARKKMLEQAIQHFDAAISLDPGYAPAYLNKACALALQGDAVRAYFYADVEARRAAIGKYAEQLPKIDILLGILDAQSNTPEGKAKAQNRFVTAAANDKSGVAAYNLALLNNEPPPAAPAAPDGFFDDESIDNQSVVTMLFPEEDKSMAIDEVLTFHQNSQQSKYSRLYFSRRGSQLGALFHATRPNYPGETARGIKLGATRADIEKKYGPALRNLLTPSGNILVFADILFVLKGEGLERWVVFKTF